jgi:hypothetical protein
MSAKQAKRLRKAAMGLTVSLTQAGRQIHERGLLGQEHRKASLDPRAFSSSVHPKDLVDDPTVGEVYAITAVNRPDSFRGIVRTLKKGIKKGTIPNMPNGRVPRVA